MQISKEKIASTPPKPPTVVGESVTAKRFFTDFKPSPAEGTLKDNVQRSATENIKVQSKEDTKEPEELYPLSGPGIEWYQEKGVNAVTNLSRSEERLKRSIRCSMKVNTLFVVQ